MSDAKISLQWVVYILKCADNSLYTGITNDLARRVEEHEQGIGAKYTKGRGPFQIAYTENCQDRAQASKREYALKRMTRAEKISIIQSVSF